MDRVARLTRPEAMAVGAPDRLLKPAALARFSSLELLAKTVVDGVVNGLHRSPHFGFSQEFAEYRAYNEGDDLRFVDWNVYARTDRTYIKRFRGDTNTSLMVALDASASMGFESDHGTKLSYARYLAASLSWLARKQHDAIGMIVFDNTVRHMLPPSTRPDALPRLLSTLEKLESASGTDVAGALSSLHALSTKRGLLVVISDFYADPKDFLSAIQPLAHSGQDIALFHIVDPEEAKPTLDSVTALRDMETGRKINVDPDYLKSTYQERFKEHGQTLADLAVRIGADYTMVDTSKPLDDALYRYLLFRQRKQ